MTDSNSSGSPVARTHPRRGLRDRRRGADDQRLKALNQYI